MPWAASCTRCWPAAARRGAQPGRPAAGPLRGQIQPLRPACPPRSATWRPAAWRPSREGATGVGPRSSGAAALPAGRRRRLPEPVAALGRADRVAAGWSYVTWATPTWTSARPRWRWAISSGPGCRGGRGGAAAGGGRSDPPGLAYVHLGDARRRRLLQAGTGHPPRDSRSIPERSGADSSPMRRGNHPGQPGRAYADLGDARRAIGYYEQQLPSLAKSTTGAARERPGQPGAGLCRPGRRRRAIGYYEQQLVIAREIGDRHGEGTPWTTWDWPTGTWATPASHRLPRAGTGHRPPDRRPARRGNGLATWAAPTGTGRLPAGY